MMPINADITFKNNIFFISGDLNFDNVMYLYQKSQLQFKKLPLSESPMLHFNFSRLEKCDSTGLALVIEWIKFANMHKLSIRFSDFPKNLLSVAKVSRIDSLIY